PGIREEYERLARQLVNEVEMRQAAGQSAGEIARWVVEERVRIANRMRWRSGPGTGVLFEVRDWGELCAGGRDCPRVQDVCVRNGGTKEPLNEALIRGGTEKGNLEISEKAIGGARYLKNGGRVIIVLSIAPTAYTLLTAPPSELERVLYEEAGALGGGFAGSS